MCLVYVMQGVCMRLCTPRHCMSEHGSAMHRQQRLHAELPSAGL